MRNRIAAIRPSGEGTIVQETQALSRREQNKLRTRNAILKVAALKFGSVGVASSTMDDIAEAADISRATLFNYFPSKSEIVRALAERMDDDVIGLIESHRRSGSPTADRIIGVFTDSGRIIESRPNIMRPLVGLSWQSWGEEAGIRRHARLTDAFVSLFGEDVRDDVDVRLVAEMLVSTYVGLIHNWRSADHYPLERRLGEAARLLAETITRR
jgi:AcrR family transcriptional regulator